MTFDFGQNATHRNATDPATSTRMPLRCVPSLGIAALAATLMTAGCGGGGSEHAAADAGQAPSISPVPESPPASPPPTPSTPETPSAPGAAASAPGASWQTALSGTWSYVGNNAYEYSAYEFHPDGTFGFYSRFYGVSTIDIVETGRYSVDATKLTVQPLEMVYNGATSMGGPARTYTWTVGADSDRGRGRLLTLTLDGSGIANAYHAD
ncbi:hypothetical protein [Piscinibacter sp. XHJ-5]|uniref:hypothetical protein n=1 Tax=Piscinibacter sp. XHJ-5 TaxID=3037797 RepID=UPI002452AFED|nr:hypothetical protein [Piscinibacter sp. XHJ-5]